MQTRNIISQEHKAEEADGESQNAYQDNGQMLRVSEAARLLGVHPNTIRCWTKSGVLRSFRIGPRKDRRIPVEVIMTMLDPA